MKNYAPVNEDYDIPTKKYIDDLISQIQSAVSSAQSAASAASTAAAQAQSTASSAASAAASAQSAAEAASSKADSAQSAAESAQATADSASTAAGNAQTTADGKAPTSHASSATTYGKGTSSVYGHLKLSASTSSTSGESGGIAATPSAVKSAYDLANTANTNATQAQSTASSAASAIETGTWTASLNGGEIKKQYCTYMKVRNMCSISFYIDGTGGTGTENKNFYISGAPFSPNSSATWYGGGCHVQGLYDTSNYPVTGCIIYPNKRIYIRTAQLGGAGTGYVRVNNGGATFNLSGSITYPVA